jgi:hypothetical protein
VISSTWRQIIDTACDTPDDFTDTKLPGKQQKHNTVQVESMAAVVLQSKKGQKHPSTAIFPWDTLAI